jgi:hypothetical protein
VPRFAGFEPVLPGVFIALPIEAGETSPAKLQRKPALFLVDNNPMNQSTWQPPQLWITGIRTSPKARRSIDSADGGASAFGRSHREKGLTSQKGLNTLK